MRKSKELYKILILERISGFGGGLVFLLLGLPFLNRNDDGWMLATACILTAIVVFTYCGIDILKIIQEKKNKEYFLDQGNGEIIQTKITKINKYYIGGSSEDGALGYYCINCIYQDPETNKKYKFKSGYCSSISSLKKRKFNICTHRTI